MRIAVTMKKHRLLLNLVLVAFRFAPKTLLAANDSHDAKKHDLPGLNRPNTDCLFIGVCTRFRRRMEWQAGARARRMDHEPGKDTVRPNMRSWPNSGIPFVLTRKAGCKGHRTPA